MSIAESPLLGHMSKSMANFTLYTLNGKNIVRSKAFKVKDAKSKKQLNVRARITALGEKYRFLSPILGLGFPENSDYKSPQNMFVAANFSTAFEMIDEQPVLRYPLMLIAKGSLPPVTITGATTDAGGMTIHFDARALTPDLNADDEIIACALLKTDDLLKTKQFIGYDSIGTIRLNYPDLQADEVVCCYVFVRSGDGAKASDSVYVEVKS